MIDYQSHMITQCGHTPTSVTHSAPFVLLPWPQLPTDVQRCAAGLGSVFTIVSFYIMELQCNRSVTEAIVKRLHRPWRFSSGGKRGQLLLCALQSSVAETRNGKRCVITCRLSRYCLLSFTHFPSVILRRGSSRCLRVLRNERNRHECRLPTFWLFTALPFCVSIARH